VSSLCPVYCTLPVHNTGHPVSTNPCRPGVSRTVKSRSYRHSGRTDSIHRCCYECHQRSQFTEDIHRRTLFRARGLTPYTSVHDPSNPSSGRLNPTTTHIGLRCTSFLFHGYINVNNCKLPSVFVALISAIVLFYRNNYRSGCYMLLLWLLMYLTYIVCYGSCKSSSACLSSSCIVIWKCKFVSHEQIKWWWWWWSWHW